MNLQKDLKEFVELMTELDVRFLIVGAFAVAYHGYPGYTADIDNSVENADRLLEAIRRFGFGKIGVTKEDFVQDGRVIQLGVAPNRIGLLTSISGVGFEEAWASRELGKLGELTVSFISREMLKRNKVASGRTQDLADLERLQDRRH